MGSIHADYDIEWGKDGFVVGMKSRPDDAPTQCQYSSIYLDGTGHRPDFTLYQLKLTTCLDHSLDNPAVFSRPAAGLHARLDAANPDSRMVLQTDREVMWLDVQRRPRRQLQPAGHAIYGGCTPACEYWGTEKRIARTFLDDPAVGATLHTDWEWLPSVPLDLAHLNPGHDPRPAPPGPRGRATRSSCWSASALSPRASTGASSRRRLLSGTSPPALARSASTIFDLHRAASRGSAEVSAVDAPPAGLSGVDSRRSFATTVIV